MAGSVASWTGRLMRVVPRRVPERSTLFYAAWTLACFLVFLALTFPHDLIVRHWTDEVAEQSGWKIRFGDVWLRPWSGYHLSDVELVASGKDGDPWFSADEVVLRPPLFAVLGRGVIPLGFSGEAYGGRFVGTVDSPSHVTLSWDGVRLGEYARLTRLVEGSWTGEVSGRLDVGGKGDVRSLEGKGEIHLKDGSLTQGKSRGFTIPDLHFASGDGELELKSGRLEIRSLRLSGSEVDADLRGQMYLLGATSMPVVSGTLGLKPIPGATPGLDPLLMLLNKNQRPPGGTYTFTVSGPLNALRVR
jgi:type II secretion system protein N